MSPAGPEIEPSYVIRPVSFGDEPLVERLFERLDESDRYRRWFTQVPDVRRVAQFATHPRDVRAVGLLACAGEEVIGHAMLAPAGATHAEVAFEVDPAWRRHGVASQLLRGLEAAARARGFDTLVADVLCTNRDMLAVFREHGPCRETQDAGVCHLEFDVPATRRA